jgi:2-phospho-L-lactate/phosphoenolpyruvate guanylyltransferase
MSHTFALLVPVKTLALAKTRLSVPTEGDREPLMRAFALDAIAAATRSPAVAQVHVVTDDPGFEVDGAQRLPDEGDGDLNRALHHAALRVRLLDPTLAVAAMCADLPSLRTDDLTDALSAGLTPRWFVADAAGTGTTLLAAGPGVSLEPHFGEGSARRHEESGAAPVRAALSSLRRDVDTEDDLAAARDLGVGEQTARALGIDT